MNYAFVLSVAFLWAFVALFVTRLIQLRQTAKLVDAHGLTDEIPNALTAEMKRNTEIMERIAVALEKMAASVGRP